MEVSQKNKVEFTDESEIPLLGVHPRVLKAGLWTPMFIAALFTIAKR